MSLADKTCVPCAGGTPPLTPAAAAKLQAELSPPWDIIDNKIIRREFTFKTFLSAIDFVNRVAALAEAEGHHPDLRVLYNRVIVDLSTHSIRGLSENDFILAKKIELL